MARRNIARVWRNLVPLGAFLCLCQPVPSPVWAAETVRLVDFNIKKQPLRTALLAFSEQAGVQLIVAPGTPKLAVRKTLRGQMDVRDALAHLVKGTGLEYYFTSARTVVIRPASPKPELPVAAAEAGAEPEKPEPVKSRIAALRDPLLIEEVLTVGTRTRGRSVTETPVPVDVIGSALLHRAGFIELGRLLESIAPSFNYAETTISDGTDIVRPATLRGLGPDQVLILVNGKRRHSQAWVNVQNTIGKGSVGTDMNTIPVAALKRVDVLRDGAAAQYGSDAIAGVINLVLNDSDEGITATASWGQTYAGDGENRYLAVNAGFALPKDGFLNLTAEYRDQGPTNRAGPSSITNTVLMLIGDTDVKATAFMWNGALPINEGAELYFFGGYSDRDGLSGGFYRHPFLAARSVPQVYPDGFLPLQNTSAQDFSHATGIRIATADGWDYDLSATYGHSRFSFGAANTINASLAAAAFHNGGDVVAASPTEGDSGALSFDQLTLNFDASGDVDLMGWPGHFSYGAEYRHENYKIEAGDPASYECGLVDGLPARSILDPNQTAICGFQGFPGYSPDVAGSKGRSSGALYAEAEIEPGDGMLVSGAVRYENFGVTGAKLTGKIAGRVQIAETLAFRSAVSTGFRAPALAQRAFSSIITNTNADGLTQTLIAPEGHAFARAYGVDRLKHETSRNYSVGLVWNPSDAWSITLDAYRIDIADRIVLGPTLALPAGMALGPIEAGSFFSNAVDTRTYGADLVSRFKTVLAGGALEMVTSLSWNSTKIRDINAPADIAASVFFPLAEQVNVENTQPHFRATSVIDYKRDRVGTILRFNYYGDSQSAFYTALGNGISPDLAFDVYDLDRGETIHSGTALIVDAEVSYDLNDHLSVAIGANNLFNKFPDRLPDHALARWISEGRQLGAFGNFEYPWVAMPWGINGGYYYARVNVSF